MEADSASNAVVRTVIKTMKRHGETALAKDLSVMAKQSNYHLSEAACEIINDWTGVRDLVEPTATGPTQ